MNGGQTASYNINTLHYSAHLYQVIVSNSAGSTASDTKDYETDGASKIYLAPDDANADMQTRQVTVGAGKTVSYSLSMITGGTGNFQVATNNSTVVAVSVSGTTLKVTGSGAGRASVRITDSASGLQRWLGVRVLNTDGTLPGLPKYLGVGSVSDDGTAALDFWKQFGTGDANRRMDARYIYINGGPLNKNPWAWRSENSAIQDGYRATQFFRNSLMYGMIPFVVWYNIADGGESYTTDLSHVQDADYMKGYFIDLQYMCTLAKAEAGNEMIGIVLEPDFLGYLAQNSNDPTTTLAFADAAYAAGVLKAGVDPVFPNTVTGLVQTINYVISKNLPTAWFGWQINLWASPANGWTTPTGSKGIIHLTDTQGVAAGRASIVKEATAMANYYMKAGVTSNGAKFVSVDKYGLDAVGYEPTYAANDPASSTWFWNAVLWENYLVFLNAIHNTTNLPVVPWQIPVGHINASQTLDAKNNLYPELDNSYQHYEDSATTFFLGDSFLAGGTRLDYFSKFDGTTRVSLLDGKVVWGACMDQAAAAGVPIILFGAGVGNSTEGIPLNGATAPTDGGLWITKVQRYFAKPIVTTGQPAPWTNPATVPMPGPSPAANP